ncbi:biopolymer transporter Tol [Cryobacterium frigoriphilum]|uniref:Biopolymer transporter Tol n=1 Tax=Cryobacterium frigoriphilum TaxID=1259150 RepID=A0A4R9A1G8_9MICO|nr:PD40 domain-containing protein [Cryobacterium frigoriphilum]TFD50246.1 biopolymer transporter Tol [Cryobacterium frigoriphilum]
MPRTLLPGQRARLWVLTLATANRRLVAESSDLLFEAPNCTPDGIALLVNGDGCLFRVPADGGSPLQQVDLGPIPAINNDHVLSPDGSTIFVSCDDGTLRAVELQTARSRIVSNDHGTDFHHYLHGISPDGLTLAYIGLRSLNDGTASTNVFTVPSAGGPDTQLTDDRFADDGANFSADGATIYFNSERASPTPGHAQIFRRSLTDPTLTQLTFDERVNWFPQPSPDGRHLAYVSFPPGTRGHPADVEIEIRLIDVDGGKPRTLATVFGGQGTMNVPSWSPDGSELAFVDYLGPELLIDLRQEPA